MKHLLCTIKGYDRWTREKRTVITMLPEQLTLCQSNPIVFQTIQWRTGLWAPVITKTEDIMDNDE